MSRELQVERGESPTAYWEMTSAAPGPGLGGLVEAYCGYSERSLRPVLRREFPAAQVVLVVGFGDPLLVVEASGRDGGRRLSSFVAGPGEGVTRYGARRRTGWRGGAADAFGETRPISTAWSACSGNGRRSVPGPTACPISTKPGRVMSPTAILHVPLVI